MSAIISAMIDRDTIISTMVKPAARPRGHGAVEHVLNDAVFNAGDRSEGARPDHASERRMAQTPLPAHLIMPQFIDLSMRNIREMGLRGGGLRSLLLHLECSVATWSRLCPVQ